MNRFNRDFAVLSASGHVAMESHDIARCFRYVAEAKAEGRMGYRVVSSDLRRKLCMSSAQRTMLELAQPRIAVQTGGADGNNGIDIASQCESNGWLIFVYDDEQFQQCVYEITPDGVVALEKTRKG